MNDEDLVFIDESKNIQWNYVNRVDKELGIDSSYEKATLNPLMPKSYKEIIMILSKASNYSRIALLLDDDEKYVAFMLVVDDDYIPFLTEDLSKVKTPVNAVYKIFVNDIAAKSSVEDGILQEFLADTVIPSLNNDFDSWSAFERLE